MRWLVLVLLSIVVWTVWNGQSSTEETSWNTFNETMLQPGDVAKIEIVNNEEVLVYLKAGRLSQEKYKNVARRLWGGKTPARTTIFVLDP